MKTPDYGNHQWEILHFALLSCSNELLNDSTLEFCNVLYIVRLDVDDDFLQHIRIGREQVHSFIQPARVPQPQPIDEFEQHPLHLLVTLVGIRFYA